MHKFRLTRSRALRLAAAAACCWVLLSVAHPLAHWTDRHWTNGGLKDAWGRLRWGEAWEAASPLPSGLDRAWLDNSPHPIRIAHALGASGTPAANTMDSFAASTRDGFRLFEVDLWLDRAGELRCQHNDEIGTPIGPTDCTLARLLPLVAAAGGWVVLDIKSDFVSTSEAVVGLARSKGLAAHVVFQLYRPEHLALFRRWSQSAPFPEPIVTVYASHRSAGYIASQALTLHMRALTVPLDDLPLLSRPPVGVTVLVHPVHHCTDWQAARQAHVEGIYTVTGLDCGAWFGAGRP